MPRGSRLKGNKQTFDAEAARAFLYSERLRLVFSQQDATAKAKVGKQTVVNIEHEHGPEGSADVLRTLADELRKTVHA